LAAYLAKQDIDVRSSLGKIWQVQQLGLQKLVELVFQKATRIQIFSHESIRVKDGMVRHGV